MEEYDIVSEELRSEIEEKIKTILVDELGVSSAVLAGINTNTALMGRGVGLDSIETMVLVLGIEEAFEVTVPDSDLTAALFKTMGTLIEYVLAKITEQAGWREEQAAEKHTAKNAKHD